MAPPQGGAFDLQGNPACRLSLLNLTTPSAAK